jgi:hypothetical protein
MRVATRICSVACHSTNEGFMIWRALLVLLPLSFAGAEAKAATSTEASTMAATLYVARTSSEGGWEDVFVNPVGADYIDAYLAVAGLSRRYGRGYHAGALQFEAEAQTVYHFGQQEYWEFNAVPIVARWQRFPWNHRIATTAAFGLGLSYTTELSEFEVDLEGESQRLLIHWFIELTAGWPDQAWDLSVRLHHRSVGYGLMGDGGGMNAVGLGVRWRF